MKQKQLIEVVKKRFPEKFSADYKVKSGLLEVKGTTKDDSHAIHIKESRSGSFYVMMSERAVGLDNTPTMSTFFSTNLTAEGIVKFDFQAMLAPKNNINQSAMTTDVLTHKPPRSLRQKIVDFFTPKQHAITTEIQANTTLATNVEVVKNVITEALLKDAGINNQGGSRLSDLITRSEYNLSAIHQLKTDNIDFGELDNFAGLPQHRREAKAARLEKQNHYIKREIVNEIKIRDIENGRPKYNNLSPAEKQTKIENLRKKNEFYEQQRQGKSLPSKEQAHIDNLQKRKRNYIKDLKSFKVNVTIHKEGWEDQVEGFVSKKVIKYQDNPHVTKLQLEILSKACKKKVLQGNLDELLKPFYRTEYAKQNNVTPELDNIEKPTLLHYMQAGVNIKYYERELEDNYNVVSEIKYGREDITGYHDGLGGIEKSRQRLDLLKFERNIAHDEQAVQYNEKVMQTVGVAIGEISAQRLSKEKGVGIRAFSVDKTGSNQKLEQSVKIGRATAKNSLDSDRDGMPDDWEKFHGLDPHNPTDALRDDSGNGVSNLHKFIKGAIPTQVGSVPLTTDQQNDLKNGKAIVINNVQGKDGKITPRAKVSFNKETGETKVVSEKVKYEAAQRKQGVLSKSIGIK